MTFKIDHIPKTLSLKNKRFINVLTYALVGAAGTCVQYFILIVLVSANISTVIQASSLGAVFGAIVNYFLNYYFTFNANQPHLKVAPKFFLVAILGLAINFVAMSLLERVLTVPYLFLQLISTCFVLAVTYIANAFWSFGSGGNRRFCLFRKSSDQ